MALRTQGLDATWVSSSENTQKAKGAGARSPSALFELSSHLDLC